MVCSGCGVKYYVADAKVSFERNFDGLDYRSEIEDPLCGDCAIDYMDTRIRNQKTSEEQRIEAEQDGIVGELLEGLETLTEGEFNDLYNQLDSDHQMEVDDAIREFAAHAVGDEHWDSDG